MSTRIGEVVRHLEEIYPPASAESWDRVGLAIGDPTWPVQTIGFAVDPCEATVNEAIERGARMLITHHPLYLRGTHSVAATTGKGRWTIRLIQANTALYCAHTNADVAASTAALAQPLGVHIEAPLSPEGIGGVGTLTEPMSLRSFAECVRNVLPKVPAGILVGGDLEKTVERVAICSGAGDSLLAAAREAGADVYLTADLRHHPATDNLWDGGPALINMTHWASEWPLLAKMREALLAKLEVNVNTYISEIPTDPWNLHLP